MTCTYHLEVQGDDYVLGGHMGIEDLPLYVFIQYKCCPKVTAILGEGDSAWGAFKVLGRERGRDRGRSEGGGGSTPEWTIEQCPGYRECQ